MMDTIRCMAKKNSMFSVRLLRSIFDMHSILLPNQSFSGYNC